MIDWDDLERRPDTDRKREDSSQIRIATKKVAVRKDQIRKLPDGTTIVVNSSEKN